MKLLLVQITRNRQGQAARSEQLLDVDTLRIGRGTDCKLYLPDPRVALHHATIGHAGDGEYFIEAVAGAIQINGQFERAAALKGGQRIGLGPFELKVLEPSPGADLALSVELIEPLKDEVMGPSGRGRLPGDLRAGLRKTWLSKRLASWLAASLLLLAFLWWPVWHALNPDASATPGTLTADASWDPGPLASGHHSFGRDCGKCHAAPFVQTRNAECEACHQSIGWHFARDTPDKAALHEAVFMPPGNPARCASCHRDHKGPLGLVRQDAPLCTQCHAQLKLRAAQTRLPDIADFARDHPPFKLSMQIPGKTGREAVLRIAQDDKAALFEQSNLKFPHDVHLSKQGVRAPAGKIVMDCKNCHLPDETGTRFKPVTMKEHCQDCHSLEFEPKAAKRQVPHGKVDDVIASVREFYAQAALADTPIDVLVDDGIRRPGEKLAPARRQSALAWATQKADKITRELMEDRVCFSCHQITPMAGAGKPGATAASWHIAPVAITQHWLPKARFPHNQHATHDCSKCHAVAQSKRSSDIAIPDIGRCRECHGGNATAVDKAPGRCETCHGFHVGGSRSGTPLPSASLPSAPPRANRPTVPAAMVAK